MRQNFLWACRLAAAVLTASAGSARAQTTSVGPYYATPSWDQTLPPATRFVVLSNFNSQAVLDRETGLVWLRAPVFFAALGTSLLTYADGWELCETNGTGSRYGWRLPTVPEFSSLIDPSLYNPANPDVPLLPTPNPFNNVPTGNVLFWTSTVLPGDFRRTFSLNGSRGGAAASSSDTHQVWCVRGPRTDHPY